MTVRRDDGLQPERTLLAWRRTALGLLANAVLLAAARPDSVHGSTLRLVLGVVMTVLALGFWGAVGAAYRGATRPRALGSVAAIRLVTGLVVAVGVADAFVVLTH
jgi:uncharacterized membrane protein YidH (DUF202 family)